MKALLLSAIVAANGFAATSAIGIVTASGHFTLQGSEVWGNATLFEGAAIETGAASSELALRNGVKVQLASDSRAVVFADRLVLQAGSGQVAASSVPSALFEVDAAGLKIRGAGPAARLRVGVGADVDVSALHGVAKVTRAGDVLLAAIPSGRRMSFAPQAAQTGAITRTGCLLYKDNHFILQDDNTQEVVELSGPDLRPNLGNRVQITGTASTAKATVTIATSVVNITGVAPRTQGGCLVAASSLNASTEMPPGAAGAGTSQAAGKVAGGGMSTGAKVGLIALIAGGGAAAGVVALESSKKSTSP